MSSESYLEKEFDENLSGNEVYCMNSLMLLAMKITT